MTTTADIRTTIDRGAPGLLRRVSPLLLRTSLALTFIWFGTLKVAGTTPVTALVADTVAWIPGVGASIMLPSAAQRRSAE